MNERIFLFLFGAAVASAVFVAAGWRRERRRLARLEDRLLEGDLEERVNELAGRVSQLARGQDFLQQFLSGQRRLPHRPLTSLQDRS